MSIQELQRKVAESKMDNVCKFVFNELATFVDWYAVSKEQNEHYMNNLLLLENKKAEFIKEIEK